MTLRYTLEDPPLKPAVGNPRLARSTLPYGSAATAAAAATGVGGGPHREEPPRPMTTPPPTLLVGCGGTLDGDGAKADDLERLQTASSASFR